VPCIIRSNAQLASTQPFCSFTPDTFVRTALPGMKNASAIVHIGPALGAAFTEYTAEFEPKGELGIPRRSVSFTFLEGAVTLEAKGKRHDLGPRGYAYLPERFSTKLLQKKRAEPPSLKKQYQRVEKSGPPRMFVSSEDSVSSHALMAIPICRSNAFFPMSRNLILR